MAEILDCKGLKCPQPILKLAMKAKTIPAGTTLEIHADCHSFQEDVTKWCTKTGKVLISIVDKGGFKVASVRF